jgi:hypothetical protein
MTPPSLDDAYVQKHARPGEKWEQARLRLIAEVSNRYYRLPACEMCAEDSINAQIAVEKHTLGICAIGLTAWPEAALNQRVFDVATEQSALHTRAQSALVRRKIQTKLMNISNDQNPKNVIRSAFTTGGYIRACEDLCLFAPQEIADWLQEANILYQKAERALAEPQS